MAQCEICRESNRVSVPQADKETLCTECYTLFRWFLDHYAEVDFKENGWITTETTFLQLSIDSLDYVHWQLEAERDFNVCIPNRNAEKMSSVGDYLRYIRLRGNAKDEKQELGSDNPLWDRGIDG